MLDPLCFLKHADHRFHIMSVNRSQVYKSEFFKQDARNYHILYSILN